MAVLSKPSHDNMFTGKGIRGPTVDSDLVTLLKSTSDLPLFPLYL